MAIYPSVKAQLNGKDVLAVAFENVTYLDWTVAKDLNVPITKAFFGDVELNNVKPPQITDSKSTYIQWDCFGVKLTPNKLDGGGFNFTTESIDKPTSPTTTQPAQPAQPAEPTVNHNYTMTVTESDTAIAGTWASIEINTLDNGQTLPNQIISITVNGNVVATDSTGSAGSYPWAIMESVDKTDTTVVNWTDPAGKVHTSTHTTTFTVPEPSTTPVPSDDSHVIVTMPILSGSDPSDAVFFELTAPNGQKIEAQLDTGAFELMFTNETASTLGLANEGALKVQGVGGTASAYYSHANFSIQGVKFESVPCVVEGAYTGKPLFGYKFFVDNSYDLLVSQKHNTITIMK